MIGQRAARPRSRCGLRPGALAAWMAVGWWHPIPPRTHSLRVILESNCVVDATLVGIDRTNENKGTMVMSPAATDVISKDILHANQGYSWVTELQKGENTTRAS